MITCSTSRFTSSRSTGASFMKFGRAPTTERTRIALMMSQGRDADDRHRDRYKDADDPERAFAVVAARHDDAVARPQPHPLDRQTARKRVLKTAPHVKPFAVPLNLRGREVGILRGPACCH